MSDFERDKDGVRCVRDEETECVEESVGVPPERLNVTEGVCVRENDGVLPVLVLVWECVCDGWYVRVVSGVGRSASVNLARVRLRLRDFVASCFVFSFVRPLVGLHRVGDSVFSISWVEERDNVGVRRDKLNVRDGDQVSVKDQVGD